jgi:hypothetical protein
MFEQFTSVACEFSQLLFTPQKYTSMEVMLIIYHCELSETALKKNSTTLLASNQKMYSLFAWHMNFQFMFSQKKLEEKFQFIQNVPDQKVIDTPLWYGMNLKLASESSQSDFS